MANFQMSIEAQRRYQRLEEKYKLLYTDPRHCEPMVMVGIPVQGCADPNEQLHDPAKMLDAYEKRISAHIELGDDTLPSIRVEFGTAQIAAAFGCEVREMPRSLPACGSHILKEAGDIWNMKLPTLKDGLVPLLDKYTEYYQEHMSPGMVIQHPDVQSSFNSAHLIRGNDILYDFYDDPGALRQLLKMVTDYMILFTEHTKSAISKDKEWFHDSGGFWKGGARISNCTLQIVSPELYEEFIMPEDIRYLKAIGGGAIHYCGSHPGVLEEMYRIPEAHMLQIDSEYHDMIEVCDKCPLEKTVMFCDWSVEHGNREWFPKLLSGRIPEKKNIVIYAKAYSMEEGKRIYHDIKNALLKS